MYTLTDTFNGIVISRHRTLHAAVRADIAHNRAVKRANGRHSYIPTRITLDGAPVDPDEIVECRIRIGCQ